ncbi:T-complex 11, partial [Phlyctochytrium arcticum]
LPESLRMDVSRLVQYYNDWQDITIMAVLLILFKQSAGPKCTPDRVRDIKRVLWVLLNDSETSMHHVTLQMCEAAGAVRGTPFEARERDMLAGLVEKTLSPDSKLFEVIRLRVGTVLDKIVRSTPTSSSSANPQPLEKQELARVGLSELEEELSELGERVKRLVQHNWRVFGNVYAVVVETL